MKQTKLEREVLVAAAGRLFASAVRLASERDAALDPSARTKGADAAALLALALDGAHMTHYIDSAGGPVGILPAPDGSRVYTVPLPSRPAALAMGIPERRS